MCQNISSLNTNVYPLVAECNQNVIPTYSRTKKVRRTSTVCTCTSNVATNETNNITMENAWKNHCQSMAKENSQSFIDCRANEQSDPCYKRMPVLMNSIDQCHHNNDEKHQLTEDIANSRDNHLQMSQHLRLSQQIRSDYTSRPGHRKVKGFGSTKISVCSLILVCLLILAINQVFAKPLASKDMSGRTLEEILKSPCGESGSPTKTQGQVNIDGILEIIQSQSRIAKSVAREGVEKYLQIQDERQQNVEEFHKTWRLKEENWLYPKGKELRKSFSEPIPIDIKNHFISAGRNLHIPTIIKLLQDCDERFQLLLIGFENILKYHKGQSSNADLFKLDQLLAIFVDAKAYLQSVLCEIRTALEKFGAPPPKINPDDVPNTRSLFYDWVIFREYINQLEHINEIVTVIRENLA